MRRIAVPAMLLGALMTMMPAGAATQTTTAVGWSFVPAVLTASPDDTIVFDNSIEDYFPHSFTVDQAAICENPLKNDPVNPDPTPVTCDTGVFRQGVRNVKLDSTASAGRYLFRCQIHWFAGMRGVLIVS